MHCDCANSQSQPLQSPGATLLNPRPQPRPDPEETASCSATDRVGRKRYQIRKELGTRSRNYSLSLVNHRGERLVTVERRGEASSCPATQSSALTTPAQRSSSIEHQATGGKWAFNCCDTSLPLSSPSYHKLSQCNTCKCRDTQGPQSRILINPRLWHWWCTD